MRFHFISNLLVMFVLVVSPTSLQAQSVNRDYTLAPRVINETLGPRGMAEHAIQITNVGDRTLRLYTTVNEVESGAANEILPFVQPSAADATRTITNWISISRARIEIPPGETHTAMLEIKIHPEAEPGEYHAFIGFAPGRNQPTAQELVRTGSVPGTVVSIKVEKETVTLLRLSRFVIDRFVTRLENSVATVSLSNVGTESVTPTGEIIYYNGAGEEVAAVDIAAATEEFGRGSDGSLEIPLPKDLRLGKYKAFLSMQYGDNQQAQVQDTIFFYVVPLYELIALFVTLIVLAVVVALYIHRRYSRDNDDDSDGITALPVFVRDAQSEAYDHDINLKKN
jgi:hypothetical protein